jgi:tetratricopeptide (TPR) repeat protein
MILTTAVTFSQKQVRTELRKGNKEYNREKYTDAEIAYRKALENNAQSKEAAYNLGNALYRQQKLDEAAKQYELSAASINDKEKIAAAMHNYGNSYLRKAIAADEQANAGGQDNPQGEQKMQSLQQSIEAYKQALRNNPADNDTRYNLALAQKLLEQENNGGGQDNKQDKQEDKEDKQDKQQQQDKKDQQEQNQQQQQDQQMQKEKAEQILEAMRQNERETQEKVKEQQILQTQSKKKDKNW